MLLSHSLKLAQRRPTSLKIKTPSMRKLTTIAQPEPTSKTCTIDNNHHFSYNSSSLPIYKEKNTFKTQEGDIVDKVTTQELVYCVSSFFTLKSLDEKPSILAVQAIHIGSEDQLPIIDLNELETPLKEQNIKFTRECITYSSCPGLDELRLKQHHTLSAVSNLCKTHGYSEKTETSTKDKVSLNLNTGELEFSRSKNGIQLRLIEATHFSSIFLIPILIEKLLAVGGN